MTNKRAAEILREYNEWLRHEGEPMPMTYEPSEIGVAIDVAVKMLATIAPTLDNITDAVCDITEQPKEMVLSKNRKQPIAEARFMAIWIARRYTNATLHTIKDYFGYDVHVTVLHAIRVGDEWMENPKLNPAWVEKANKIINRLKTE